ncbi:hypothetical protein Gotur_005716 [Gossypium turneri]
MVSHAVVLQRNEKPSAKIIPMVLWLNLRQGQMGVLI